MLLREDDLQLASLDSEAIHLVACLPGHVGIGILDKGEALGLLRMVISRDVDVAHSADASEGHLEVLRGNLGADIPNQQRDSWRPLAAATIRGSATGGRAAASAAARIPPWSSSTRPERFIGAVIRPSSGSVVAAGGAAVVASSASVEIVRGSITRGWSSVFITVPAASSSLVRTAVTKGTSERVDEQRKSRSLREQ